MLPARKTRSLAFRLIRGLFAVLAAAYLVLAGWWVPSEDPQAATLLYLHGNAGNVAANAGHVLRLRSTGLNVFIFDYRGYGDSTGGPPREKLVYEDAERAWAYLVAGRNIPPANIVIYGHSLGGAIAIDLASRHPEAGASSTECTLTSVVDRAAGTCYAYLPIRLIVTERFDSIPRIRSIHLPKLILQVLSTAFSGNTISNPRPPP